MSQVRRSANPGCQGGFALVTAIVILVLLSVLAGYLARIATFAQIGSAQDIQGYRAYHAAKAGLDWGLHQVLNGGTCSASPSAMPAISADVGLQVFLTCNSYGPYQEGTNSFSVYRLTAIACNASACPPTTVPPGYVERSLSASVAH